MTFIRSLVLGLAACTVAALPAHAQSQTKRSMDYLPIVYKMGMQVPYPIDVVYGVPEAQVILIHYSPIDACNDDCRNQMAERLEALTFLRPEIQRKRFAILWRPLVKDERQARAAMSFACLPPENAVEESIRFLQRRTDPAELPVPERYAERAEALGIDRDQFMACVDNEKMWSFYTRHTRLFYKHIIEGRPTYDWIRGMSVVFNGEYLKTFSDFINNPPNYSRAQVLTRLLPSDIVVGTPSPDRVRLTLYMAPDGMPERVFVNKYLQKFIQVYVAGGEAYLVIRPFPWLRPVSAAATEFLHCVPPESRLQILEQMYMSLDKWRTARTADPRPTLMQLGAFNGLNERQLRSCMNNPNTARKVVAERKVTQDQLKLVLTPTIFINDKLFAIGTPGFADLMAAMRVLKAEKDLKGGTNPRR
jgi:hypothetical protein